MAHDVVLTRGRGRKRKLNGRAARLLSDTPNGGGWVTVELLPLGEDEEHRPFRVKWRNGAWRKTHAPKSESRPADVGIPDLSDDILARVLRFLSPSPSADPWQSNRSDSFDFEDAAKSPTFIPDPFLVRDAARFQSEISLISKQFHALCQNAATLSAILGPIDADFTHAVYDRVKANMFKDISWITKLRLRLRSLKLKGVSMIDASVIVYILRRCDVSSLCILDALVAPPPTRRTGYEGDRSTLDNAWFKLVERKHTFGDGSINAIAIMQERNCETNNEKAAQLGIPDLLVGNAVNSIWDFHDIIASECLSLRCLKTNIFLRTQEQDDQEGPNLRLFSMKSLQKLHMVLPSFYREYGNHCTVDITSPVTEVIAMSTTLKVLHVSGNVSDSSFKLHSPSLVYANWQNAGKNAWVTKIDCPRLRRFVCKGTPLGNGIRPRDTDTDDNLRFFGEAFGTYKTCETRFDGTIFFNGHATTFEALNVHPSCCVELTEW